MPANLDIPKIAEKRWNITPPGSQAVKLQKEILNETMQAYQSQVIAPLEAEKAQLSESSQHVNYLLDGFKTLQNATLNLTYFASWSLYSCQKITSDEAVSITTTPSATHDVLGSIEIEVVALAKSDRILSQTVFDNNRTALNLDGNLVINGVVIALKPTDTLENIVTKIRDNTPIKASIVMRNTHEYVLSLMHQDVCVSIDGSASDEGIWSGLKLPPPTPIENLQANITVDGITGIRRNSNVITDVMPGVQLNLNKVSTQITKASIIENKSDLDTRVANFVKTYNACQKAIAAERAFDPSDPTQALPTALLKNFSMFSHVEAALKLPSRPDDYRFANVMSVGYKLENGQLIADNQYKQNTTIEEQMQFFASSCTVLGDFSQTMPSTYNRQTQTSLSALHNKPITVTIHHHADNSYTATLSAAGIDDLELSYNPITKNIIGTGAFEGLDLTYNGADIDLDSRSTATLTLREGFAHALYRTLDKTLTKTNDQPSTFDQLAQEIQNKTERIDKNIQDKQKTIERKAESSLKNSAQLAMLESHMKNMEELVHGVVYGKRPKD